MSALPDPRTFLSGEHGSVRRRERALRRAGDALIDAAIASRGTLRRVDRLAASTPPRDVVVASIYRPQSERLTGALPRLESARHRVALVLGSMSEPSPGLAAWTVARGLAGGKFQNLNVVLDGREAPDWLIVVDDDVALPQRFLDRFLGLCEHFELALAQPAQTLASHAAWPHLRRRAGSLVRETRLVEIGPLTAFRRDAAAELTPFPPLRYGWGLDLAWGALADERGWRRGVVDALPVRHEHARVAAEYSSREAIEEARRFLAERPYLTSARARETLATHRRLPR